MTVHRVHCASAGNTSSGLLLIDIYECVSTGPISFQRCLSFDKERKGSSGACACAYWRCVIVNLDNICISIRQVRDIVRSVVHLRWIRNSCLLTHEVNRGRGCADSVGSELTRDGDRSRTNGCGSNRNRGDEYFPSIFESLLQL